MVWDELGRDAEDANLRDRDRWIGVYVGILAVVLAICSMGGDNAGKEATLKNIEAANTWSFFQAKNIRRGLLRAQVDDFEVMLATETGLTPEGRRMIEEKVASYKALDKELTTNPKTGEGLDELFVKGKALEGARDVAMAQDPYFDYAEALLQIAIVLAGVAIITGGSSLLIASAVAGSLGALFTLNGFFLFVTLPFLG